MAKNPQQLNQKQVDVLKWVCDGCPAGIYTDGWEHRIVARALEHRGLVTISGHGDSWVANATAAGRAWLENPPVPDVLPNDSAADQLIAQVLEADGSLTITATDRELKPWERLVRLSLKSPNRPKGKQLFVSRIGNWNSHEWKLSFTEYFDDHVARMPVPVPGRVAKYHPIVRAYLDDRNWHFVSKEYLPQAARVLQAIATEAERRGIQVLGTGTRKNGRAQTAHDRAPGHLWLILDHGDYSITIKEIPGAGGAKRETRDYSGHTPIWLNRRQTEFISTGRLELVVEGPLASYQGEHFRDAKAKTVEDKLPDVFVQLQVFELKAEWQEQERRRQEAERRRRWEAAVAEAKAEFAEHARWEHFKMLAKDHERLNGYRKFLAEAQDALASAHGTERAAGLAYLAEMKTVIDDLDPISSPELLIPRTPEPTAEELRPFLSGWSPYGPER
ncbi:hypothetical protein [Humibacter ginsengiterrae]